jgi:ABC-2 type transport system permease protein
MAGNSAFELVSERGWRRGLGNLLDNEFGRWWKTREWWVQALIWVGVIGFMLSAVVFGAKESIDNIVMIYCIFASLFPAVAVVILMQDAVVGEKQNGTAAWVLSKPASRQAFILSKLAANSVGVLVTMVLLPGIVAYILMWVGTGSPLAPLAFLVGLVVIWLFQLFFLAFTLMLGTLFSNRGPVIGLSLALLFFQQYLVGWFPPLKYLLPWTLVVPLNNQTYAMVPNLLLGQPVSSFLPLFFIVAEIVIFVLVALWRFEKEEF